jgi:hypothetical protein
LADGSLPIHEVSAPNYERMGPSLLAQQPVTAAKVQKYGRKDLSWWDVLFAKLEARRGALYIWRHSFWVHWSILAQYFLPRRWQWLVVANRTWRGSPINDSIIDSTGLLAVRTCAAGLWTGLTSPSRPWFKIEIALPWVKAYAAALAWLEDTQKRVYTVLAQSNFYQTMAQAFQDVVVFGTAPVIEYEDFEDVIRFYLPTAGEYFLAAGARFSVDVLNRDFNLTVSQLVEFAGIEKCPEQVRNLWVSGGGQLETEFTVCHSIEPNFAVSSQDGKDPIKLIPGVFTFRETYWLRGTKTEEPIVVRGFYERPFFAARWSTVSNEPYGRSPCMDALGDNKQVQLETKRKAEYIEKGIRPPMGADPNLKNEPSSIIPGNITYVSTANGAKGFWPLFEVRPEWLAGMTKDIDTVNARIDKALFVDLFMAISRMEGVQPRNELELTKRDLERLQELGPFVHMFENEFAGPAIQRTLNILRRRRMLKPLPQSMLGVPLKITYVSIMKLAQNAAKSVSMKDVFQVGGILSSAAKAAGLPDPLRTLNLDKAFREYADVDEFPQNLWYPDDEVQAHDEAKAHAAAAAQVPGAAMAAVDAAKTMSETSLGGGSALGAMLGGAGGPGGGAPGQ